jgi:hypothetical protein
MKKSIRITASGVSVLLASVASAVLLQSALAQVADPANPYAFEKKAYKTDGTPWSGPVNVGDVVKYVLSYKPGSAPSGPATIEDTLSPNLQYVAPTRGPGWTWSGAPYASGNKETYKSVGFGPGSGSVKVNIPGAPNSTTSSGSGDGTIPIPIAGLSRVFGIFHHGGAKADANIDCWELGSLAKCPGYPKWPSTNATFAMATGLVPEAVVRNDKIFYMATVGNGGAPTIACFDAAAGTACPDQPLGVPGADVRDDVAGLVEDPVSKSAFAVVGSKMFCRTWSGSTWVNCGGWTALGNTAITGNPATSYSGNIRAIHVEQSAAPTRVYSHHGSGWVQCLTIAAGAVCPGWPAAGIRIGTGSLGVMLSSLPDNAGTGENGVCLWDFSGNGVGCLNAAGGAVSAYSALGGTSLNSYRLPGTKRVYFPRYVSNAPLCLEYTGTTAAPCPGFTPARPAGAEDYGFSADPLFPDKCLLALGHSNMLWRFDFKTGQVGCGVPVTVSTPPIESLYCNGAPDPVKFSWSSIRILTSGAAGVLTVKKGLTTTTLAIVSGTTNYPMPTVIGTGSDPVTFSFAPTGTSPAAIDLDIGFTAETAPPICYQAKVNKCGPVLNTAVFKASFNNAPVSTTKNVDLGEAKGSGCVIDPPPPPVAGCLSTEQPDIKCGTTPGTFVVTLKPMGAAGVVPDTLEIASLTPGVTITPMKASYAVSGGQVQITLTGAKAGDVIDLDVSGTKIGAGKSDGTDICCNGKVKIVIPKDLDCGKQPAKLTVEKSCACSPAAPFCACKITVKADGPVSGPISISETLTSPGGHATTTSISSAQPWTCTPPAPPTLPAGTPVTCSLPGADLNAASGTSVINVAVKFDDIKNFSDGKNCATLSVGGETLGQACDGFDPKKPVPKLSVVKTCGPAKQVPGAQEYEADCKITVTASGTPLPAKISITESPGGPANQPGKENKIVTLSSAQDPAWTYPGLPLVAQASGTLSISGADLAAAGGTSVVSVKMQFPDAGNASESNNCVSGSGLDAAGAPLVPALASPKVCANFGAFPPKGTLPPVLPIIGIPRAGGSGGQALVCDANSAKRVGDVCQCTTQGAELVSRTRCECPDGTTRRDGKCVNPTTACQDGTRYSPELKKCVAVTPVCQSGTRYNPDLKKCVSTTPDCQSGTRYNAELKRCQPICRPGTRYNPALNACVEEKKAPQCDARTAVPQGDSCACRYPNMERNGTRCICPRGSTFADGKGCVRRTVECQAPLVLNPASGTCVRREVPKIPVPKVQPQLQPKASPQQQVPQPPRGAVPKLKAL